jgi:Tfp pilus assembly protein PilV
MSVTQRLRSEAGFGIIEVLVTAMVVMIVSTAVLGALDAASKASGRAKARSVAMTLAQGDQERLRAMPIAELANVRASTKRIAKICQAGSTTDCVEYTISSQADWVSDSAGIESCTTPNAGFDYLKITSTVTWASMGGADPVKTSSMVTPIMGALDGARGNLAVKVVRADGVTGVPGVRVNLTGPVTANDVTNGQGCVVWGALPAGNGYTVGVDEPNFVDVQGNQALSKPAGVVQDSLSTTTLLYDGKASAAVSFYSVVNGAEWPDQKIDQVTLQQSQMQPVTRMFGTAHAPQASLTLTPLFPFNSDSPGGPYRIYAGGCQGADPAQQSPPDPDAKSLPDLSPGAGLPGGYRLQIPAFDFKVTVNGTVDPTAKTKIVPTTAGCDNPDLPDVSAAGVVSTGPDAGRPAAPGFPHGTYDVCAQSTVGGVTRHVSASVALNALPGVKVTAPAGAATGTVNLTTSSPAGACP